MTSAPAEELKPQVAVACVVCGSNQHQLVSSAAEVQAQLEYLRAFHRRRLEPAAARRDDGALADRADFTQDYVTDIVSCDPCGLVFRDPRPPAAAVTAAYAHDEYGAERLAALFDSQLELFRPRIDILRRMLGAQRSPSIVEVGSFVGGFLAAAREQGWNPVGIDPGAEVVEFCRRRGLMVHRSTAADAPIAPQSTDCVAIWSTFDQLPDPRPTLQVVRKWLRPGGLLAVRVPNGACYRSAIATLRRQRSAVRGPLLAAMAWNNLLAFPYLHGYSIATLNQLLEQFGFSCVALHADTLTRLADSQTKGWAVWEERLLKSAWGLAGRLRPEIAPWFDAYFRTAGSERQ